jgi:uncharacterized membrane-anchored protein
MYLWNISVLESKLKAGTITQRQYLGYFLIFVMLFTVGTEISGYMPDEASLESILSSCFVIFSTLLGVLACYTANRKGDDKDFLERYIALSLPIGIKMTVLFICLMVVYMLVLYVLAPQEFSYYLEEMSIVYVLLGVGVTVFFYMRLYKSIRTVASNTNAA